MTQLYILGASVFAQEVADVVSQIEHFEVKGFIEGIDAQKCNHTLSDLPIVWIDNIPAIKDKSVGICAVGTTKRKFFIEQAIEQGLKFTNVFHPTAILSPSTSFGEGIFINTGAIIAAHTKIGNHVIINRGTLIGHHVRVADYVTISPGSNIAGRVEIGERSYIGMGAIVIDGISIGENSIVGAGAVVTRNVPDNVKVMGIPAKIV